MRVDTIHDQELVIHECETCWQPYPSFKNSMGETLSWQRCHRCLANENARLRRLLIEQLGVGHPELER